jgi:hypothetical protein
VKSEQARRFGRGNGLAVHRHTLEAFQLDRRCVEHLAIQRHASIGDHPFDLAPAGDTRAGEQFCDPVSGFGQGRHGRGFRSARPRCPSRRARSPDRHL